MDGIAEAVSQGAVDVIKIWGPPGFFLLLSIIANVYQWRQANTRDKDHRDEVKELNKQITVEIKAGIAMAQEYKNAFEVHADNFEKLLESRRGR